MAEAELPAPNSSDPTQSQSPPGMESSPQEKQQNPAPVATTVKFSIWPPSQRTRDAVIARLIDTLSNPSVLTKRYGTVPADESASTARLIEDEAFAAANGGAAADDDGIEILQIYSKEVSKRMLDFVKSRPSSSAAPTATPADSVDLSVVASSEEAASTVESEA
ncbi:hypothetical protein SAY86_028869 [Trapa natans]|uniref:WPP domain-containing protein n=1 Tax=Trapa natans TaxID=22666 RepID=A0AAN7LVM5_TRANT|nr:hypothetical protein SAY86_028869 [Trapa natans]